MKNISLALNIVLIVAVGILYYLHFSTAKPTEQQTKKQKDTTKTENNNDVTGVIAYVNADSIAKNYKFYDDIKQLLQKNQEEMQKELTRKEAGLERKAKDFQDKIAKRIITSRQAEETQKQLMQEQQQILALREQYSMKMVQDEQDMNKQLFDSIESFLTDFNAEQHYQVIFSKAVGGNLLYAGSQFDITQEVLKGLNERYEGQKPKEEEK